MLENQLSGDFGMGVIAFENMYIYIFFMYVCIYIYVYRDVTFNICI